MDATFASPSFDQMTNHIAELETVRAVDPLTPTAYVYAVMLDKETEKKILKDLETMGVDVNMLNANDKAALVAAVSTFPSVVSMDNGEHHLRSMMRETGAVNQVVQARRETSEQRAARKASSRQNKTSKELELEQARLKAQEEKKAKKADLEAQEKKKAEARENSSYAVQQNIMKALTPLVAASVVSEMVKEKDVEQIANHLVNMIQTLAEHNPQAAEQLVDQAVGSTEHGHGKAQEVMQRVEHKLGGHQPFEGHGGVRLTALPHIAGEKGIEDIGHLDHTVKKPAGLKVGDDMIKGLAASLLAAVNEADHLPSADVAPDKRTGVAQGTNMARLKNPN